MEPDVTDASKVPSGCSSPCVRSQQGKVSLICGGLRLVFQFSVLVWGGGVWGLGFGVRGQRTQDGRALMPCHVTCQERHTNSRCQERAGEVPREPREVNQQTQWNGTETLT